MNDLFLNIINTIKEVIINPKEFWVKQKKEETSKSKLLLGYLLPILLVVAIAVFLGEFFRLTNYFIEYSLLKSARIVLLFVLQYYISVFFTNELIKTFGGEKNRNISKKLVIYSLTPFLLASLITGLFPFLYVIEIVGFYGFYIFWIGVDKLLIFPENKKSSFTIISIVVNFFIFSFLSITLSTLLTAFY